MKIILSGTTSKQVMSYTNNPPSFLPKYLISCTSNCIHSFNNFIVTMSQILLLVIIFDNSLGLPHILLLFVVNPDNSFHYHKRDAALKKNKSKKTKQAEINVLFNTAIN